MGFEGASAIKSIARKLTEDIAPNAIYVHCFAHCSELILQLRCDKAFHFVIRIARFVPISVCNCLDAYLKGI